MTNRQFRADQTRELYLRVPDNTDRDVKVELKLPRELAGKYIKIFVACDSTLDVPIKADCKEEQCERSGVIYCPVHYGNTKLADTKEEKKDLRPTILGHPNCRVGDCWDCHVFSCSIHAGFVDMP